MVERDAAALAAALDYAATSAATEIDVRGARIAHLQRICDQRAAQTEELEQHLAVLRTATEERGAAIATLDAALKQERERYARAEVELSLLRRTCEERATVLRRLSDENDALRAVAEERAKLIELNEAAYAQREALNEDWRAVAESRADAAYVAQDLASQLSVLQAVADERAAAIAELDTALREERAQRSDDAQQLAALAQACEERMALIDRLSQENETLRNVAEERAKLLERNDAAYAEAHAIARESERAMAAIAQEAERRAVLLADLTAEYHTKVREVEELRRLVPRAS